MTKIRFSNSHRKIHKILIWINNLLLLQLQQTTYKSIHLTTATTTTHSLNNNNSNSNSLVKTLTQSNNNNKCNSNKMLLWEVSHKTMLIWIMLKNNLLSLNNISNNSIFSSSSKLLQQGWLSKIKLGNNNKLKTLHSIFRCNSSSKCKLNMQLQSTRMWIQTKHHHLSMLKQTTMQVKQVLSTKPPQL